MKNNKSLKTTERVIQFSNPMDLWKVEGGTAHVPLPLVPPSSEGEQRTGDRRSNSSEGPHRFPCSTDTEAQNGGPAPGVLAGRGCSVTRRHPADCDCREVA